MFSFILQRKRDQTSQIRSPLLPPCLIDRVSSVLLPLLIYVYPLYCVGSTCTSGRFPVSLTEHHPHSFILLTWQAELSHTSTTSVTGSVPHFFHFGREAKTLAPPSTPPFLGSLFSTLVQSRIGWSPRIPRKCPTPNALTGLDVYPEGKSFRVRNKKIPEHVNLWRSRTMHLIVVPPGSGVWMTLFLM